MPTKEWKLDMMRRRRELLRYRAESDAEAQRALDKFGEHYRRHRRDAGTNPDRARRMAKAVRG